MRSSSRCCKGSISLLSVASPSRCCHPFVFVVVVVRRSDTPSMAAIASPVKCPTPLPTTVRGLSSPTPSFQQHPISPGLALALLRAQPPPPTPVGPQGWSVCIARPDGMRCCLWSQGVRVLYVHRQSILARALTAHSNSIQSSLSLTHMRQPLHTVWWVYLNGIFVMVLTRPTGLCIVHSLYLNYYSVYSTAQARVGPHPYRLRPSRRPWPEARPRPVDPMLATLSVLSQPDAVCRQPAAPPWTGVPTLTTAQYRIATT